MSDGSKNENLRLLGGPGARGLIWVSRIRTTDWTTDRNEQPPDPVSTARPGPLGRPLFPYDTRLGDQDAITPQQMARHTAALDLDDAHVIFLGGRNYADLLRQSVPHTLVSPNAGLGEQRAQCHLISRSDERVQVWWQVAARLADHPAATSRQDHPAPSRRSLPLPVGPHSPAARPCSGMPMWPPPGSNLHAIRT